MTNDKAKNLALLATCLTVPAIGIYVFRDGIGLVVFGVLGVAVLIQLVVVAFDRGSSKALKDLWSAFKDAFWGIG